MAVERTGFPIKVPVGPETLGRLFDALGQPLDGMPALNHADQWPIHRPAPRLRPNAAAWSFSKRASKLSICWRLCARGQSRTDRRSGRRQDDSAARIDSHDQP